MSDTVTKFKLLQKNISYKFRYNLIKLNILFIFFNNLVFTVENCLKIDYNSLHNNNGVLCNMEIGVNNLRINKINRPEKKEEVSVSNFETTNTEFAEKSKVNGSLAATVLGIKQYTPKQNEKTDNKEFVSNLSFAENLKPEEKETLTKILDKNNEETPYFKKLIDFAEQKKVTPRTMNYICENGVVSDLVKNDIDIYYDKVIGKGMSVKDAFIPECASEEEGNRLSKAGDLFRVKGQDKVYIKSGDDKSKQLKIDADTCLKLYPPVERYSACQGKTGNCYFIASIQALMGNPNTREIIYSCFTQNGNDISVTLPGSENTVSSVSFENGELPENANRKYYSSGPVGMQLLEGAYGSELKATKEKEYSKEMFKQICSFKNRLDYIDYKVNIRHEDDKSLIEEQKRIEKDLAQWQKVKAETEQDFKNPNTNKVLVSDPYGGFIYGEYGPVYDTLTGYNSRIEDFYLGAQGGITGILLSKLGVKSELYSMKNNESEIEKVLTTENPDNYIILAGTNASEDGKTESPVALSYSIYSAHEYSIKPFDDENGNRMYKVTNPWNGSHPAIMGLDKIKEYFDDFTIAKVKE